MGSPSQSLTKCLTRMLSYKPGEQDMAIIYNIIDVEWPDKSKVSCQFCILCSLDTIFTGEEVYHIY